MCNNQNCGLTWLGAAASPSSRAKNQSKIACMHLLLHRIVLLRSKISAIASGVSIVKSFPAGKHYVKWVSNNGNFDTKCAKTVNILLFQITGFQRVQLYRPFIRLLGIPLPACTYRDKASISSLINRLAHGDYSQKPKLIWWHVTLLL